MRVPSLQPNRRRGGIPHDGLWQTYGRSRLLAVLLALSVMGPGCGGSSADRSGDEESSTSNDEKKPREDKQGPTTSAADPTETPKATTSDSTKPSTPPDESGGEGSDEPNERESEDPPGSLERGDSDEAETPPTIDRAALEGIIERLERELDQLRAAASARADEAGPTLEAAIQGLEEALARLREELGELAKSPQDELREAREAFQETARELLSAVITAATDPQVLDRLARRLDDVQARLSAALGRADAERLRLAGDEVMKLLDVIVASVERAKQGGDEAQAALREALRTTLEVATKLAKIATDS